MDFYESVKSSTATIELQISRLPIRAYEFRFYMPCFKNVICGFLMSISRFVVTGRACLQYFRNFCAWYAGRRRYTSNVDSIRYLTLASGDAPNSGVPQYRLQFPYAKASIDK